jgi:uncharacterized membrane protein YeiH
MLVTVLDVVGTFAFALSGGARAVENRMDAFGVVFLSFVAAVTGGILRDVLIGAVPPAALQSGLYVAIAIVAGMVCFFWYGLIVRLARPVAVFDAIGLGLFCVVGTSKALDAGLSAPMAAFLGMLTAIGGGLAADVLTARSPMVFRREIYALAALTGALLFALGGQVGVPEFVLAPIAAVLATSFRLVALSRDWHLPPSTPDR